MSIYIRLVLASVSVIEWHHVVTNDYDCNLQTLSKYAAARKTWFHVQAAFSSIGFSRSISCTTDVTVFTLL